jgi:hypothetical protein
MTMKRNPLRDVADLVSPLAPFGAAEDRQLKEEVWVDQLTPDDLAILLAWLHEPTPIPATVPVEDVHLQEVADRVAYYVGTAGKRLGLQAVRASLEELLRIPYLRISALEGLDAFGDRRAIGAIRTISKERDPAVARQIAFVLGSLGGAEAQQVLQEMLASWGSDALVRKTIEGAIEEAGEGHREQL